MLSSGLTVDLGCGTGLAGVALHRYCTGRFVGCDLSRRMLTHAAHKTRDGDDARGGKIYDELVACDVVAYLQKHVPDAGSDLIIAADVLVYMRELDGLFRAAHAALAPGGTFAFSTELARDGEVGCPPNGPGWIERPSERMAHLESYVRLLASNEGLEVVSLEATIIRNDESAPIWGQVCIVRKANVAV